MFRTLVHRLRASRHKRIVIAHLSRMNDHDLADIGIARQDIDLVVRRGRLRL